MNTVTSYSHLLGSSTKIPMLIPEFYEQWADRMDDYLNGIDKELWNYITEGECPIGRVQHIVTTANDLNLASQAERLKANNKGCLRELRGALPPTVYRCVCGYKTSKEISDTLQEMYQGNEKMKKSSVKQCLIELGEFRQNKGENIELYYDRLNELIFKCSRYGVNRSTKEYNFTFLMGLGKEW